VVSDGEVVSTKIPKTPRPRGSTIAGRGGRLPADSFSRLERRLHQGRPATSAALTPLVRGENFFYLRFVVQQISVMRDALGAATPR